MDERFRQIHAQASYLRNAMSNYHKVAHSTETALLLSYMDDLAGMVERLTEALTKQDMIDEVADHAEGTD